MKKKQKFLLGINIMLICLLSLTVQVTHVSAEESQSYNDAANFIYDSPFDLAYSPDGKYLAVSNTTAAKLDIIDIEESQNTSAVLLQGQPKGVVWYEDHIFVAEGGAGSVARVDSKTSEVIQRFDTGIDPVDVAIANGYLLATDSKAGELIIINVLTEESTVLEVLGNPNYLSICPNERYALVGHLTPAEFEVGVDATSLVSIVDLESLSLLTNIKLPYGASNVRQIEVSNDGNWAYVAHTLGKTSLPVTHITKGWVNTNAISIIDLNEMERYTTFLLDRISEGAANPWGLAISDDDNTLWVSISGTHQVLKLDMEHLLHLILGEGPEFRDNNARNMLIRSKAQFDRPYSDVWFKIKDDPANLELLQNDLGALWGAGIMDKIQLPGQGPRGIAISPDNTTIAVGTYYTGEIFFIDAQTNKVRQTIALGGEVSETGIRRGEMLFHDATLAQQSWLSCSTCHPGGGSDGLMWDLPGERFGDPADTKSLHFAYDNLGDDLTDSIHGAYWVEMITQPYDDDVEDLYSYIKSLGTISTE